VNIRVHENPNNSACIRCLACVRECPKSCITVGSLSWSLEADRAGCEEKSR
jgi:ferredoxin